MRTAPRGEFDRGSAPPATARHGRAGARTPRRAVVAAGLFGFTGVAAGAFGAHALKTRLDPEALSMVETAARYQLIHALALVGCGWVAQQWPGRAADASAAFFAGGIVLFSGSLYALALTGVRALGAITPLGGLFLLLGWLALALAATRGRS
jgi:uncharacterized membrane protein YgdD (TMEM256/DUF423 family)